MGVIWLPHDTDAKVLSPYHVQKSKRADNQDRADFRIWGYLDQIMGVIWLYHDTDAKVLYPCHVHKSEHAENQDCADFRIWG